MPTPWRIAVHDDAPTDDRLTISGGTIIDQYRISEKIGEGGMGEVYKAEDTTLKRQVALKFLSYDLSREPASRDRFLREAQAAARLAHPNIVSVYGTGEYKGLPYCAMAFIEGWTLAQIKHRELVTISRVIEYGIQIADAVAAAHENGVTHRDLKPSNIIISSGGTVHVVDFGLALIAETEPDDDEETTVTKLTDRGALAGTIPYMAPEQLRGETAGTPVDIFALGVILHELTCGTHPFAKSSPAETAARILRDEPANVLDRRPDAPYDLARIIHRCLRKDPQRRFQSARDIRNELLDLQESSAGDTADINDLSRTEPLRRRLEEKEFILTAEMVRKLDVKSPKMIGDRLVYLDNGVNSEVLIIFLHAWGLDHRYTVDFLASLPYRGIAPTLYGFDRRSPNRLPLTLEDQSVLMREFFSETNNRIQPRYVVLSGFSSGADHALHLVTSDSDLCIPVTGLLSFGCNVSLDSCFISSRFAELKQSNPRELLEEIKKIGNSTRSMNEWLKFHEYMVDVFSKFGDNADPLRSFGKGIVEPFRKHDWKQFAHWYRTAMEKIPHVRFVIDSDDFDKIDEILARHLESNVLGDRFREDTIVRENVSHIELADVETVLKHTMELVSQIRS